jgi:hypothetical protein
MSQSVALGVSRASGLALAKGEQSADHSHGLGLDVPSSQAACLLRATSSCGVDPIAASGTAQGEASVSGPWPSRVSVAIERQQIGRLGFVVDGLTGCYQ